MQRHILLPVLSQLVVSGMYAIKYRKLQRGVSVPPQNLHGKQLAMCLKNRRIP